MSRVAEATVEVLEPYVGTGVAKMCVRSGAKAVGSDLEDLPIDQLPEGDLAKYMSAIGAILNPVAPHDTVESWLAEIERRARL